MGEGANGCLCGCIYMVTDFVYLFPGTDALRGHSMMMRMMIMLMMMMIMLMIMMIMMIMIIMMMMMRMMMLMIGMQQKPLEFPSNTNAAYGNESQPYKIKTLGIS
jgi:flagellar basal body-associated protein FliL